ncbi:MAG TPA: GH116 family glycosyl-hydrolase [Thermomicrobiales bacterium]|nr:GH116 family glycosyl-hydrolase [Thermomicrobiales bacterium]
MQAPPTLGTRTYTGEALRAVAMPLGGLGTGTIALAGDGSLRQWQIHNQINHLACVPHSFFAVWAHPASGEPVARVLQSAALYDTPDPTPPPPPTSNDHVVPLCHRRLMQRLPGVAEIEYTGEYPIATLRYHDSALPVRVSMEAFNPFVPLDADASGIPVVIFNLTVENPSPEPVAVSLLASLQNAVGWDGVAPIFDTRCELYGGNVNALDGTTVVMASDRLPGDHPGFGTMALTAQARDVSAQPQWSDLSTFWADFARDGRFDATSRDTPSVAGRTWNGALAVPFTLPPGESHSIPFSIAWHFPNRLVDTAQLGLLGLRDENRQHRIGNRYATRFASASDVARHVGDHLDELTAQTRLARDTFFDTTLPPALIETVTSQMSIVRSPTCFWTEDGRFYGFEGCNGASTSHHTLPYGGCCPLNCTHVWNYEMALARLFPDLERSMRDVEWDVQQHPTGYLPHRVLLPLDLPRPWDRRLGGPDKPALDGLLGAILKTWREYRASGDAAWLAHVWPSVVTALDYVWTTFDPDHTGVIEAEQPNTYDISIFGANTFIGTLYLAALRAVEEMATLQDDAERATACRETFARGRDALERRLWNGSYYIQEVDLTTHPEQNWATGCHSDHLLGQWWAHVLDLGHLLDPAHLRTAARSIVENNFRESFVNLPEGERRFVSDDDHGLIVCTWPNGGRPDVPTRYSDEVWTGLEYEVAGLLLYDGDTDLAMQLIDAVRARHDGTRGNPWNDIECGDHYVRALASWALLEAASGFTYEAARAEIGIAPVFDPERYRAPFVARDGYGTLAQTIRDGAQTVTLDARHGTLTLERLRLHASEAPGEVRVSLDGAPRPATLTTGDAHAEITFAEPLTIAAGQQLAVTLT